jgi:hypothetical protein
MEEYAKQKAIEFLKWDDNKSGIIRPGMDYKMKYDQFNQESK